MAIEKSDVNTKVSEPSGAVDVIVPGLVVYVPNRGALMLFPLYILRLSQQVSTENSEKFNVTKDPGVEGKIVIVPLSLFE